MLKKIPIYKTDSYESANPIASKQVKVLTLVGHYEEDVSDKAISDLGEEIFDLSNMPPVVCIGIGQVYIQTREGVFPQPIEFRFDESITSYAEAFKNFDIFLKAEVENLQEEQNKRKNALAIASGDTLQRLDKAAEMKNKLGKKSDGGILLP